MAVCNFRLTGVDLIGGEGLRNKREVRNCNIALGVFYCFDDWRKPVGIADD